MRVNMKTDHLLRPSGLSSKLLAKWTGPFTILEVISPVAARLDLPASIKLHPVVHVSNLKPVEGNPTQAPQAVFQQADGEEEFEVEDIIGSRMYRNRQEFLVKWKGYPISECTWEPHSNLENAQLILKRYTERLAQGSAPVQKGGSVRVTRATKAK